jgi:hypothetical protein
MAPHKTPAPPRSNIPKPNSTTATHSQPVRHLYQEDVARRWGVSPRTLERWRWEKKGPPYLKIGRHIVYRVEDIEMYESQHMQMPPHADAT